MFLMLILFRETQALWPSFAYCKAGCNPHRGKRSAETEANTTVFYPARRPTTAGVVASATHSPLSLPLGTRGLDLAWYRPLLLGEGTGHRVLWAASLRQLFCERGTSTNTAQARVRGAPGARRTHGHDTASGSESTSPMVWWEAPGGSLQTTCQPSVPCVPHGCALPWALWLHLRAMFPTVVTL